jgi:hypothetical protein
LDVNPNVGSVSQFPWMTGDAGSENWRSKKTPAIRAISEAG